MNIPIVCDVAAASPGELSRKAVTVPDKKGCLNERKTSEMFTS